MIRFINLRGQIEIGEPIEFTFYNTVTDVFCSFNGENHWTSIEDFKNDFQGDDIERYLKLIPNELKPIDKILRIIETGNGALLPSGKPVNTGVIQLSGDAKVEYIFSERDVIKNFLIEIKSDIEQIDCGCSGCISDFLSGVNPVIEKYGLELKLNGESSVCSLGLDLIDKTENHP